MEENEGLKIYAEPEAWPVALDDVKAQARIDNDDEDDLLNDDIKAATLYVEKYLGRMLITQTWDLARDDFPVGARELTFPYGPVQSITSITYIDGGGITQTLSSTLYTLDTYSFRARLYPEYGQIWPAVRYQRNAVIVRHVLGYGDTAADVPADIRKAIKILAAHWYQLREATTDAQLYDVPHTVEALLAKERQSWL